MPTQIRLALLISSVAVFGTLWSLGAGTGFISGRFSARRATPEQQFWHWFAANSAGLQLSGTEQPALIAELERQLDRVHPGLTWEISEAHELVISADGVRDRFPAVQKLVGSAPRIPGWRIIAFRQPCKPGMTLRYEDYSVNMEDVWFRLEEEGAKVGVTLFMPHPEGFGRDVLGSTAFLLLDAALGEYDVEMKVGPANGCRIRTSQPRGVYGLTRNYRRRWTISMRAYSRTGSRRDMHRTAESYRRGIGLLFLLLVPLIGCRAKPANPQAYADAYLAVMQEYRTRMIALTSGPLPDRALPARARRAHLADQLDRIADANDGFGRRLGRLSPPPQFREIHAASLSLFEVSTKGNHRAAVAMRAGDRNATRRAFRDSVKAESAALTRLRRALETAGGQMKGAGRLFEEMQRGGPP